MIVPQKKINKLEALIEVKKKENHITSKMLIQKLNLTYPTYSKKLRNETISYKELKIIIDTLNIDSEELIAIL